MVIKSKFNKINKTFNKKHYNSSDGMLTSVWGPSMWHYLHTVSFNYPINPTNFQKKKYMSLIKNMQYTLPCKHCRINLKNNLKNHPITMECMVSRETFSKYVYKLHEIINKMLNKKSGLSYCDVRERYENFRARCTDEDISKKLFKFNKTRKNKEKGCMDPLYGKKAKCIIKIVPKEKNCKTFQIDSKCIKSRKIKK